MVGTAGENVTIGVSEGGWFVLVGGAVLIGIVVGVILQFSAYYVTRRNQNQSNAVTETGRG